LLSFRRNESSTAFLSHWFTDQLSTPVLPGTFSATRNLPASSAASASLTASRTSPLVAALTSARFSQALSTTAASDAVVISAFLVVGCDCVRVAMSAAAGGSQAATTPERGAGGGEQIAVDRAITVLVEHGPAPVAALGDRMGQVGHRDAGDADHGTRLACEGNWENG
jgi:hypothetical protein